MLSVINIPEMYWSTHLDATNVTLFFISQILRESVWALHIWLLISPISVILGLLFPLLPLCKDSWSLLWSKYSFIPRYRFSIYYVPGPILILGLQLVLNEQDKAAALMELLFSFEKRSSRCPVLKWRQPLNSKFMVAMTALVLCDHMTLHLGADFNHLSAIAFCPVQAGKGLLQGSSVAIPRPCAQLVLEQLIQTPVVTLVLIFIFPSRVNNVSFFPGASKALREQSTR